MANRVQTVVVWLTDGSGGPFPDLHRLPVTHRGMFGPAIPYQGTLDPTVSVGTAVIDAERADDALFPEAEWCLTLPAGLASVSAITSETPVVLQGFIEGKWINRLRGTLDWGPASRGNNLLAAGPGLATTLSAIEAGEDGEVVISYHRAGAGQPQTRFQRTALRDLQGHNILDLVNAVLTHCRVTGQAVDWIDLSALSVDAAIVNEPDRLQAAVRASGIAPTEIATPAGFLAVADAFVAEILASGLGVPPGEPINLTVRDRTQSVVGQGQLIWRPR